MMGVKVVLSGEEDLGRGFVRSCWERVMIETIMEWVSFLMVV
jgi:hypothetical protein